MKRYETIFCIVVVAIGVSLLVNFFFGIFQTLNFLERCLKTKGVIVDCEEREYYQVPVFQFVDNRTGKVITVHGSSSSWCLVGTEVDVLYDPENPYNAEWFRQAGVRGMAKYLKDGRSDAVISFVFKENGFWAIWGTVISFFGLIPLVTAYTRRKRRTKS